MAWSSLTEAAGVARTCEECPAGFYCQAGEAIACKDTCEPGQSTLSGGRSVLVLRRGRGAGRAAAGRGVCSGVEEGHDQVQDVPA
eukprot:1224481-Rhodomonas_salina.8